MDKYMAYYIKNRYISLKLKAIEYKGGKCIKCGYDKCYAALTFHHRDPKQKDMEWSYLRKRSWEFIINELDKCDLVCCNCHAEIHHDSSIEQRVKNWENRPRPKPVKGTTGVCEQCNKTFIRSKWDKNKKYCSSKCVSKSQEKISWPDIKTLKSMVNQHGLVQTGKMLNVSGNAVKKRLKKYSSS